MKSCRWIGLSVTLSLFAATAHGLIKAPMPMAKLLGDSTYVVLARVAAFEPQKRRMILTVTDDIKGKPAFRQVPVTLNGNDKGKELKHPVALLKRLANDLPVVLFILHQEKTNSYTTYVYTNGTWFELKGNGNGKDAGVWDLTSGEPYLRRTFKGTTEEMRRLVSDNLAGKAKLPGVNGKGETGLSGRK